MTLADDICPVPNIAPMTGQADMDAAIESARAAVGLPVGSRVTTTIVVETLVYDATRDRLAWRATSETRDPKDLQHFITDLVSGTVKEMKKMKLVGKP